MKMFRRIISLIMVIVLVAIYASAFVLGISGSDYFPISLLLCVIVPVLFYAISLMTKVLGTKGKKLEKEAEQLQEEANARENADEANNVEK